MSEFVSIVVVDDHPLFRSGVVASLREFGDMQVVGEGASADDAARLVRELSPDVALLDISMPGDGLAAAAAIRSERSATKVVMLTVSEDDDDVLKALDAGASGYALKGIVGDELVRIIRAVATGATYVAPTLGGRLLLNARTGSASRERNPFEVLTAREMQIASLLTDGLSNKEIGRVLNLQEKTVKHHMTQILQKLQVRNRVEAAMLARDHLSPGAAKTRAAQGFTDRSRS
ncbi:MAG: response regulator transcription factor [Rhizobiaceae bacterium]|nr:response regulator transcription factor [Rhizobiaceae bacterium]